MFKYDLGVALYFFRLSSKMSKSYVPLLIISSVIKGVTPFINIVMPGLIINEIMAQIRIEVLTLYVLLTIVGNAVFGLTNNLLDTKLKNANFKMKKNFELHLANHIMKMDFEMLEDSEILDMKEKALYPVKNQNSLQRLVDNILKIIQAAVSIIGSLVIISTLNVILILFMLMIVILNTYIFKKSQETQFKFHKELIPLNRRYQYYAKVATDFTMGKDVRLYNMAPYMLKKIDTYINKSLGGFGRIFIQQGKYNGLSNVNIKIQTFLIYAYSVYNVLIKRIAIGDFLIYVNLASKFTDSIYSFLTSFIEFRQMCKYLDLYMKFEQIPTQDNIENGREVPVADDITIEFKNVYFKYPKNDDYTLKDISLVIKAGERISIVGQNGAGKTTFIKLLCRLYEPDSGEILLNGIDINKYTYKKYMDLLAVVFQDFRLFAFSVKENTVFGKSNNIPDEEVIECIKMAGLYERIVSLDKGIHTSVYKRFDDKGIEFSGGESQKLAIARAISKNAKIVVLDEPTSALDPYAEYEIYMRFNEIIKERTAIFISHRLSSCRFCDKVVVFEDGRIIQSGHHDELSKMEGKYAEMWKAQSHYYVDINFRQNLV